MTRQSYDDNFKNIVLDFTNETLELFFPEAQQNWARLDK